jgi:hypothetical protein
LFFLIIGQWQLPQTEPLQLQQEQSTKLPNKLPQLIVTSPVRQRVTEASLCNAFQTLSPISSSVSEIQTASYDIAVAAVTTTAAAAIDDSLL